MAVKEQVKHTTGLKNGERCECGQYHYTCEECGSNCTLGSKCGPATRALDGITRCRECHWKYEKKHGRLIAAAPEMHKHIADNVLALEVAATVCDTNDLSETAKCLRDIAKEGRAIIAKAEGR